MSKIPGRLKEGDVASLAALANGKNVLQIGCYCGRSLVEVARVAWATWVLHDFHRQEGVEGVTQELKANTERLLDPDADVNLIHDVSPGVWVFPDGSRELPADGVDLVYRDANRREETRELDDILAVQFLKQGGVYAWHDANGDLKWLKVEPTPTEVN